MQIAISANGTNIVWSSGNAGVLSSQAESAFATVSSLPAGAVIASDKKSDTTFYAASGAKFFVSTDGGKTFAATAGALGSSTSPVKVVVNPKISGDVWVSTDKGLFHSTDSGASFTTVSSITQVALQPALSNRNRC